MCPIQLLTVLSIGLLAPVGAAADATVVAYDGPTIQKLVDGVDGPLAASVRSSIEEGGPWLGVQFGPVPKPLAAQLGLEPGVGQMILNVVKDSPADAAGFERYDVILRVGDAEIPADTADFLETVRDFAAGEHHQFTLIRGGKQVQAEVTVGRRPAAPEEMEYKYEPLAPEVSQGRLFQRGGILQRDDQGHWNFNRLDQLDDLKDVWKFMPKIDDDDLPPTSRMIFKQHEEGLTLHIERDEDGSFTVTKTEGKALDRQTTTNTYANEEAFEEGDAETYKVYKKSGGWGLSFKFNHPGIPGFRWLHGRPGHGAFFFGDDDDGFDFDVQLKLDDLRDSLEDMRKKLKDDLKGFPDSDRFLRRAPAPRFEDESDEVRSFPSDRTATSFSVTADGAIKVTTRLGEDELVETFENADALEQGRPDLFEKYRQLKEAQTDGGE